MWKNWFPLFVYANGLFQYNDFVTITNTAHAISCFTSPTKPGNALASATRRPFQRFPSDVGAVSEKIGISSNQQNVSKGRNSFILDGTEACPIK